MQGSRILSRSFNIPVPAAKDDDSVSSSDMEDTVAMIPIADALNAASGCNNARLFNTDDGASEYTMTTVGKINAGDQIVGGVLS